MRSKAPIGSSKEVSSDCGCGSRDALEPRPPFGEHQSVFVFGRRSVAERRTHVAQGIHLVAVSPSGPVQAGCPSLRRRTIFVKELDGAHRLLRTGRGRAFGGEAARGRALAEEPGLILWAGLRQPL